MRTVGARIVAVWVASMSIQSAFAADISVCASGCDHALVQDAVDGATAGDTILLEAETYAEAVTVDRDLTLRGKEGSRLTVATGTALTLTCTAPPCDTIVEQLELEVTGVDGRGMQINDDINATFRNLVIRGGNVTGEGGGVNCQDATLVIEDTEFVDNTATTGGGLHVDVDCAATLVRSRFVGNSATDGGHIYAQGDLTLLDSRFEQGSADTGSVLATTAGDVEARRNLFCDNDAAVDQPVVLGGGTHTWTNNVFLDHDTPASGVVMVDGNSSLEFVNNTLLDNGTRGLTGAQASVDFRNNLVARSVAGVGIVATGQTTTFDYNSWYGLSLGPLEDVLTAADIGVNSLVDVDPVLRYDDTRTDCSVERALPLAASPLINAGDPAVSDLDGSRSDIGAFGGPEAAPAWWADGDGDSGPWVYDCDDTDDTLGVAAPDVCDGIDNDCDGAIDAADSNAVLTRLRRDLDGDGYGNGGTSAPERWDCPPVDGWVANGQDCNDNAATAFPGGIEVCDLLDNDCNGVLDDGFETTRYYVDQDGDGFGRETPLTEPVSPADRCTQPPGYVTDNTDCDDSSAVAFPGNDFFDPYDGFDNQCTGVLEFDGDGDGHARDTNGGDDCDDTDPDIHPGVEDIPNDDIDQDCVDGPVQLTLTGGCACSATGTGSSGWSLLLGGLILAVGNRRRG